MRHWGSFNVSESFQIVCRSTSDTWGGQIKEYDEKTGRWMRHNNQYVSQLNGLIIRWILALMRADTHLHVLLYLLLHLTPHTSRKAQVCSKLSPLLETTCCAQILSRPRWWLLCRPDEKSSTKPMNSEERRRLSQTGWPIAGLKYLRDDHPVRLVSVGSKHSTDVHRETTEWQETRSLWMGCKSTKMLR